MPSARGITDRLSRACARMSTALRARPPRRTRTEPLELSAAARRRAHARSVTELLAQYPLVEAVTRIEQHLHGDAVVHVNVDRTDRANLVMVGDGGDRTFLRLEHLNTHARAVGQERAAPAPRPKRTDRGERHQRRADRNDRTLSGEIVRGR